MRLARRDPRSPRASCWMRGCPAVCPSRACISTACPCQRGGYFLLQMLGRNYHRRNRAVASRSRNNFVPSTSAPPKMTRPSTRERTFKRRLSPRQPRNIPNGHHIREAQIPQPVVCSGPSKTLIIMNEGRPPLNVLRGHVWPREAFRDDDDVGRWLATAGVTVR